jgi:hypothetical protein
MHIIPFEAKPACPLNFGWVCPRLSLDIQWSMKWAASWVTGIRKSALPLETPHGDRVAGYKLYIRSLPE